MTTTHTRTAILTALQNDAAVTALVPAASIYPGKAPGAVQWPFIRYGASDSTPLRAACWRGAEVNGAVHIFAKVAPGIPDPEAFAGDACDAIAQALEAVDDCHVRQTRVLGDPDEADAWHGIVQFAMTVAEEV